MNVDDVAIATVTLVRDSSEETLLRRALARLSAIGAPVYASDGGSPPAFLDFVRALPHVHLVPQIGRGLVAQVQTAMKEAGASGRAAILYTESDKEAFFRAGPRGLIDGADPAACTIAARSEAAFATYPALQQFTERTINQLTGDALQVPGDYSYGPFILPPYLAAYVGRIDPSLGWGWRHFIFATALRVGRRVTMHEGDFECPPGQRAEDASERLHRLRQLGQNVNGLVAGLTAPL